MKKLIIVCEERLKQYGDFLSQLISLSDDKENNIIGVKDGSVAAQVWTEKEYNANSPQISSEQYILFIGNTKMIKDKRTHMIKKFDKYGMKFGWLGKQAVLVVDNVVDIDKYDEFIEYAKSNKSDVKKLIEVKPNTEIKELPENTNGFSKFFSSVSNTLVNASIQSANLFNKITNNSKIEGQEYTYLVLEFYFNALADFLGLSEV